LKQQKKATIADHVIPPVVIRHKELMKRFAAGRCEVCKQNTEIRVHQIRKLADLDKPGVSRPAWMDIMAKRRRKTLMVCQVCHEAIHARHTTTTE
jgi:hypothetical protein